MSRPFAGKPVGARRNNSGAITHIMFQHRKRAMPIYSVSRAVTAGITSGIRLVGENGRAEIRLCPETSGFSDFEDLPEV